MPVWVAVTCPERALVKVSSSLLQPSLAGWEGALPWGCAPCHRLPLLLPCSQVPSWQGTAATLLPLPLCHQGRDPTKDSSSLISSTIQKPSQFGGEKDFFPYLQFSFLLLPILPAFHSSSCKRISGSESIISLYRCFFNFLPLSEANLFPLKMQCPFPRPQWEFSIP